MCCLKEFKRLVFNGTGHLQIRSAKTVSIPEIICDTDALMYCRPMPWTMMESMFSVPGHASTLSSFHVFRFLQTAASAPCACTPAPVTCELLPTQCTCCWELCNNPVHFHLCSKYSQASHAEMRKATKTCSSDMGWHNVKGQIKPPQMAGSESGHLLSQKGLLLVRILSVPPPALDGTHPLVPPVQQQADQAC